MPLDPTHVRLKLLQACDQWHSSWVATLLPVDTLNYVETRQEAMCTEGNCIRQVRAYGDFFDQFILEDAIGSHACLLTMNSVARC
jgi:hypothetical protein